MFCPSPPPTSFPSFSLLLFSPQPHCIYGPGPRSDPPCVKIGMLMRKVQKGLEIWGKFLQVQFVIGFSFSPPHEGVGCIFQNIRFAEVALQRVLFLTVSPPHFPPSFPPRPFFLTWPQKKAYRHVAGILVIFLLVSTFFAVPRHLYLLVWPFFLGFLQKECTRAIGTPFHQIGRDVLPCANGRESGIFEWARDIFPDK